MGAEFTAQIHPDQGGGGLAVLGEDQLLKAVAGPGGPVAQGPELGGFAGAVRPLEYDQPARHHRTLCFPRPLARRPAALTRTRGSLAMRPMRLGSFTRR